MYFAINCWGKGLRSWNVRLKYGNALYHFKPGGNLNYIYIQYVQPFIVSSISHLCALNLAIDWMDGFHGIDFKWILGKARRATRDVAVKEVQVDKKTGKREEIKKTDCGWRRCSKSLCWKNSLLLPFICRYIGSSRLSGSQRYIWNEGKKRRQFNLQAHFLDSFLKRIMCATWFFF